MTAHEPVMVGAMVAAMSPRDGGRYVDGTFGWGGYARALLDAADCNVLGIDRDPLAAARGRAMAADYPDRLRVLEGRFSEMEALLASVGVFAVDGVAFDLGVSSMQLDEPERGFSFSADGPLDMRMQPVGPTAADVVNEEPEARLADIIFELGEERRARRVARAIVEAREKRPIERTRQLADIVAGAVGRAGTRRIHPATRTFQALRIYVNDELGELTRGLQAAERLLAPEGRLVVVAFHSLEDRIVKTFLRRRSGGAGGVSRHRPPVEPKRPPSFRLLSSRAKRPTEAEIARNPRARSARLRAAERTDAAPWPALEAAA